MGEVQADREMGDQWSLQCAQACGDLLPVAGRLVSVEGSVC